MLEDSYVKFIVVLSAVINTVVFFQEAIVPTSAEHWQVGLAFLFLALISYVWNRVSPGVIKEYTILVLVVNGVLAVFLDVLAWVFGW